MQQFAEWERSQMAAMKVPTKEYLECTKCKSAWMETVLVGRYDRNRISQIGQQPLQENSFHILRCVRCGELHEPPISRVFNHPESKIYDNLLDTLEAPEESYRQDDKGADRSDEKSGEQTTVQSDSDAPASDGEES